VALWRRSVRFDRIALRACSRASKGVMITGKITALAAGVSSRNLLRTPMSCISRISVDAEWQVARSTSIARVAFLLNLPLVGPCK